MLGDESFVALGKGGTQSLTAIRDLMALVQEAQYRSSMAGSKLVTGEEAAEDEAQTTAITHVLSAILSDPSMLERGAAALMAFEMPPLMLGIKSSDPAKLLAEIFDSEREQQAKAMPQTKVFRVSSALGGHFTLLETKGLAYLTPEMVTDLIARLPTEPEVQAKALREGIAAVCATIQQKTLCMAYGTVADQVIITIGSQRPSLEFARDADSSLLSRPELAFAQTYGQKSLVSLFFIEGGALDALRPSTPLLPIARGLLSGLSENDAFAKVLPALHPYLDAFATAEHAMNDQQRSAVIGVLHWDKGLHLETRGGTDATRWAGAMPLQYPSLLTDPGVLFGIDMRWQPEVAQRTRTAVSSKLVLASPR
jgi:hypothetical protein